MTPFVLDASVLAKLFRDEEDSDETRTRVENCAEHQVDILAPDLMLYELLGISLHYEVPFAVPMEVIGALEETGFRLSVPTANELLTAEKIARSKLPSHGHPGLEDSIYHAMAIERGGTFVTADRRHFAKAQRFGNIVLLSDWQPT